MYYLNGPICTSNQKTIFPKYFFMQQRKTVESGGLYCLETRSIFKIQTFIFLCSLLHNFSLSFYPSLCLSVCLYVFCLTLCFSVCLSLCFSVSMSLCFSVYLYVFLSVFRFFCLFHNLFLSFYLSLCLSLFDGRKTFLT